jgi:hypothetical protein
MNMLSTPFDGHEVPRPVPGSWYAATSTPAVPSLPHISAVVGEDASARLATPWDATAPSIPDFPSISELPTL